MIVAVEMLFGRKTRTEYGETEAERRDARESITVVPLAMPLHTGPASITTAMVLFHQAQSPVMWLTFTLACVAVYGLSLAVLLRSDLIFRFLRPVGTKVITRIMGLLLSAIAVQFVANGVVTWVNTALRSK
jgi:multiple antibiotic resistance protein